MPKIAATNFSRDKLIRFASNHPSMVELNLRSSRIAPGDAVDFVRELISLKQFQFVLNNRSEYDQLVNKLDSEWKHEYQNAYGFDGKLLITLER